MDCASAFSFFLTPSGAQEAPVGPKSAPRALKKRLFGDPLGPELDVLIPKGILTLGAPNPLFDACKTLIKRGGFAMGHQNIMGFIDKTSVLPLFWCRWRGQNMN